WRDGGAFSPSIRKCRAACTLVVDPQSAASIDMAGTDDCARLPGADQGGPRGARQDAATRAGTYRGKLSCAAAECAVRNGPLLGALPGSGRPAVAELTAT